MCITISECMYELLTCSKNGNPWVGFGNEHGQYGINNFAVWHTSKNNWKIIPREGRFRYYEMPYLLRSNGIGKLDCIGPVIKANAYIAGVYYLSDSRNDSLSISSIAFASWNNFRNDYSETKEVNKSY